MGGTITPEAGKAVADAGQSRAIVVPQWLLDPGASGPIEITGMQMLMWGPLLSRIAKEVAAEIMEFRTGKPHVWLHYFDRDASVLVPKDGQE